MTRHLCIFIWSLIFLACGSDGTTGRSTNEENVPEQIIFEKDLGEIKEEGKLRAITIYSATSYFLYRGQPMGYEYEMLSRLADDFGLELEIIIARDIEDMIYLLNQGEGDLIAHGLTVTNERKERIAFTNDLYLTNQVLVQRKPDNWRKMKLHQIEDQLIMDAMELIDDTVTVPASTAFYTRLKHLEDELGGEIHIDTNVSELPTEALIEMVENKEIKYTVADKYIADVNAAYFEHLHTETAISFSQQIAWATRKNSPLLLDTINTWIERMKKRNDYYVIYNKYFKNKRSFVKRKSSDYFAANTGKISRYDDLIKKNAERIGWDWRLVSSVVYQESQFNPQARSWARAGGLMQLMPATARDLGVSNVHDPHQNLRGGTKYLKQIYGMWDNIPDSIQRVKFTLASYNCGFYHVLDATKLAEKYNADPLLWDGSVETYVLNLSYRKYYRDEVVKYGYVRGREPVNYVKDIFDRYEEYRKFVE